MIPKTFKSSANSNEPKPISSKNNSDMVDFHLWDKVFPTRQGLKIVNDWSSQTSMKSDSTETIRLTLKCGLWTNLVIPKITISISENYIYFCTEIIFLPIQANPKPKTCFPISEKNRKKSPRNFIKDTKHSEWSWSTIWSREIREQELKSW